MTRHQAREDRPEEAGIDLSGQQPADEARHEAGSARDGMRDVAAEHRQHQRERGGAEIVERPDERRRGEVRPGRRHRRERDGRRQQHAAAGDERYRIGHTCQKVLPQPAQRAHVVMASVCRSIHEELREELDGKM